jgi:hypothetical protein
LIEGQPIHGDGFRRAFEGDAMPSMQSPFTSSSTCAGQRGMRHNDRLLQLVRSKLPIDKSVLPVTNTFIWALIQPLGLPLP